MQKGHLFIASNNNNNKKNYIDISKILNTVLKPYEVSNRETSIYLELAKILKKKWFFKFFIFKNFKFCIEAYEASKHEENWFEVLDSWNIYFSPTKIIFCLIWSIKYPYIFYFYINCTNYYPSKIRYMLTCKLHLGSNAGTKNKKKLLFKYLAI